MSRWPTEKLGRLCFVTAGGTPPRSNPEFFGGDIPWVKISDMLAGTITRTEESLTSNGLNNCAAKLLPPGTLLVSIFATVGRTALLGIEAATNQAIVGITPHAKKNLSASYLRLFLDYSVATLTAQARGVAQVNINSKILKDLEVPLPSMAEQERIVRILDEAEALRRLRIQADERTNTITRSLFHQLFGSPTENTRNWERQTLEELLDGIDGGWSPTCHDRPPGADEWGVLKLGAVTTCQYLESESKALPDHLAPRPELEVKAGDLLFTRKNTYDLVAACAFVFSTRPKLMLSDLVFRFQLKADSKIEPMYLWGLLTEPNKRKQVQTLAGGSAGSMPNISKARLMTLEIEVPPVELQRTFATRVAEIRALQAAQAASRQRLDDLFRSLLHRAFQGEL